MFVCVSSFGGVWLTAAAAGDSASYLQEIHEEEAELRETAVLVGAGGGSHVFSGHRRVRTFLHC